MIEATLKSKERRLSRWLGAHRPLVVAFSGGVDSSFLLARAWGEIGSAVTAVTAFSPLHPAEETEAARTLARRLGVRHILIAGDQLRDPAFVRNDPDRCYVCKRRLFRRLGRIAARLGAVAVVHGATVDDADDYRPGHRAAAQMGVSAPLADAGLGKDDIRSLSRAMGLGGWDRPAQSCLASRIPYGTPVDGTKLGQVAEAERALAALGVQGGRVRHHGDTARIEVGEEDIPLVTAADARRHLVAALRRIGFDYVAVDLQGYVQGSLNRRLEDGGIARPEGDAAGI